MPDTNYPGSHGVRLRVARPGDHASVSAFLQRLSSATIQARYLLAASSLVGPLADRETQRLLDRDRTRHVVVVAVEDAAIRGIGEFVADDAMHLAEVGLVVEDAFQNRGIGRALYRRLESLARQRGIRAFTGDVHQGNARVQHLLRRNGRPLRLQPGYASSRFVLALASLA
jgi:GNAT superfamily N-acetyltransferase